MTRGNERCNITALQSRVYGLDSKKLCMSYVSRPSGEGASCPLARLACGLGDCSRLPDPLSCKGAPMLKSSLSFIMIMLLLALAGCTGAATPTDSRTPVPTWTPVPPPTWTPEPTRTPPPTWTPAPVSTPTATSTPTPVPTATPAPVPTATPTPVPTATATPTPVPVVRVIYAVPADREPNTIYKGAIENAVREVQSWYASQLDGYTFAFAKPTPQVCSLHKPADYYARESGWDRIVYGLQQCTPVAYLSSQYVWIIYPDVAFDCERSELGRGGGGVTILHRGDLDGLLNPDTHIHCGAPPRSAQGWIGGLAHELGHAFGLDHPPGCDAALPQCDNDALMWLGFYWDFPDTHLTEADMRTLKHSPFLKHRLTE